MAKGLKRKTVKNQTSVKKEYTREALKTNTLNTAKVMRGGIKLT